MRAVVFRRDTRWVAIAVLLYLAHAATYLYFFVDDEGITLVYARNLLEGRGLTYAASDGPSEGYSNFLHVIVMAGLLMGVNVVGLHDVWAFAAGGGYAVLCGTGVMVVLWVLSERMGLSPLAKAVAVLLLALAGPFAVWSNSSLETVPFALLFLCLIGSTLPQIHSAWLTALSAIALMLMRIDGGVFVAAWLAARFLAGNAAARRQIMFRVVPAVVCAGIAYLLWRYWYFEAWLSLPLQTKVAHKLIGGEGAVNVEAPGNYAWMFVREAGSPLILGLAAVVAARFCMPAARAFVWSLGLAVTTLLIYVGLVGDWMFGFRFVVPLLPPLALLCAIGIAMIERRHRPAAYVVSAAAVVWALVGAVQFERRYEASLNKVSFWSAPSTDPALRFGEYFEALQAIAPMVEPGMLIAYHEAGFVPFMLEGVENLDMLGLTSPFVGGLPTQDAVFTDVGRYYPLTSEPPHHAVHAYMLARKPALIVVRKSWMLTANRGQLIPEILGGAYRFDRETRTFVVYRRADRAVEATGPPAERYLENLAHPAYARGIAVNGRPVEIDVADEQLPFLWQGGWHHVLVDPAWALRVELRDGAPAHELYLHGDAPSGDVHVEVTLSGRAPGPAQRFDQRLAAGQAWTVSHTLEPSRTVDTIEIRAWSTTGAPARFRLFAVRVMGQREPLRRHLARHGIPP